MGKKMAFLMGMRKMKMSGETLWPLMVMVLVRFCYAGMNIISKVALEADMDPYILAAYRQIVATIVIAPFALSLDKNMNSKITKQIMFQIFLCSIFGATGNQIMFLVGLKYTTATIGSALNNVLPAFTFMLAIPFGLEKVRIRSRSGQAKIIGTSLCIGGAMLLSFYHGHLIEIGDSKFHWDYAITLHSRASSASKSCNSSGVACVLLGPVLVLASTFCWAIWFIIQGQSFDAPYTTTTLMSFMSALQCICIYCSLRQPQEVGMGLAPAHKTRS